MTQEVKILSGITIIALLIILGGIFLLGKSGSNTTQTDNSILASEKKLVREDSYKIASPTAKITIVEFSDFQCPACKAAHPIIQQILTDYKTEVNFVYRHFPLPSHRNSELAAETAEAAGKQGKFFDMQDILFENQSEWSNLGNPLEKFAEYAKSINLNIDQFKKDVNNRSFYGKIRRDITDGNSLEVNATPTFFINGIKYTGVLTLDNFKNIINTSILK